MLGRTTEPVPAASVRAQARSSESSHRSEVPMSRPWPTSRGWPVDNPARQGTILLAKDPSVEDRRFFARHCFRRHTATDALHVSGQCYQTVHLEGEHLVGGRFAAKQQHAGASLLRSRIRVWLESSDLRITAQIHTASEIRRPYACIGAVTPKSRIAGLRRFAPGRTSGMQASYDFLRAARALLDITPKDLAEKAGVSTRSIVRIEAREPVGLEISLRVQAALEELGVEFLPETKSNGPAMRVRKGLVKKIGFQLSDR